MHRHYSNTVQAVSPVFLSNFAYGSRDEMHAQWDIEVLFWGGATCQELCNSKFLLK